LGISSLWFTLDPNPEAVWREFVLGENAGKFSARSSNYFVDFIRGGDSIWMLLLTDIGKCWAFRLCVDCNTFTVLARAAILVG
jgi:hypothetical protein